jgi:type VI secretion system protein ImpB
MAKSFQREKPPARVNLFLDVDDGGAAKKKELPLRTLVLGDYTGREDTTPVEERKPININKDNFEDVLKSLDVGAEFDVKDHLRGGDEDEIHVNLKFDSMKAFKPEEVAKSVPATARLLAMRNLLQDLRNRVVSTSDFRKQLDAIVKDPEALKELQDNLDQLMPPDAADGASDDDAS